MFRQPHWLRTLVESDHVSFLSTNRCQMPPGPIQTGRSLSSQIGHLLRRTNVHMQPTLFAKSFDRPAINAVVHACEHARSVGVKQECRIKAERLATFIQNGELLARCSVPQPGSVWTTGEQQPIIGADVQLVGTFLLSPELLER